VAEHVDALVHEGKVQEIGEEKDLVWAEYADQLRTFALRRQRRLAATVDLAALQRHLLRWQHVMPAAAVAAGSQGPRGTASSAGSLGQETTAPVDRLEDTLDLFTGLAFPMEFWDYEVLTARVPTFTPAMLDGIARGGHRVWVGGRWGESDDVAVAFWPRHLVSQRPGVGGAVGGADAPGLSTEAQRVLDHLAGHGASFFFDLQMALTMDDAELALALRELAARGRVSSDALESLRDVLRMAENATRDRSRAPTPPRLHSTHARHVPRPSRMPRHWWKSSSGTMGATTAGNLGGRWFVLPPPSSSANPLDLAERAADRVDRLLRRTAFACRELLEPSLDGTWRDAYDVLTRMEWAGTVRRGYFVDGIQGSQFALPAARLEAGSGAAEVTWLSMLDPANIWAQASTRWISDTGLAARVPRAAGNWVALVDGRPVLAATSWGNRLIPLPAPEEQQRQALLAVASLFPRLPRNTHPYLQVRYWDQGEIAGTPFADVLRQQGFGRDTQGLRLYRQYHTV
jgi:ATP-dependent Lhr-like helicase